MAVDITLLFRASVKTVKTRNKALGVAVGGGADGSRDELFRRSPRPKGDFSSRAREVISHIGKLRDFLLEHRKEYINAYRSKLEPEPNTKRKEPPSEKASQNASQDSEEKPAAEELPEKPSAEAQPELGTWGDGRGEDELSPEEIQMFEQENQRLIGEMNSLFDEVRQIEGKVVEISRLQEIFTEKVLQQETEIDNIHQLVVGATENIKEGNEDIREAIKNNAGFRVWILFFLVMCSFSLLFLDWYDS
ncbi:syntaxin-18 isoform X3 [Chionomys nivalis]|uniref:syntaxin-18 isoform X3 n=1 Tax=Chionomys nivalis TaxID=269649 RepID=UPI002598A392|nr:syntaxin-18 isoform X3 [Chionomys nivalis]